MLEPACLFAQGQWSSEENRPGMTCDVASSAGKIHTPAVWKLIKLWETFLESKIPNLESIPFFWSFHDKPNLYWGKRISHDKRNAQFLGWHPFLGGCFSSWEAKGTPSPFLAPWQPGWVGPLRFPWIKWPSRGVSGPAESLAHQTWIRFFECR